MSSAFGVAMTLESHWSAEFWRFSRSALGSALQPYERKQSFKNDPLKNRTQREDCLRAYGLREVFRDGIMAVELGEVVRGLCVGTSNLSEKLQNTTSNRRIGCGLSRRPRRCAWSCRR